MKTVHTLPSDANITGRNFGAEELEYLRRAIESGTLNCTRGTLVNEFQARFAERYGASNVWAVTSGTAAIHTAIAAIDPEPGDEIVTTPITDMGAITPIIYQAAIPIFADVDPTTYNITAETIEPKIGPRTKAIIVTHLFGAPCDMDPIMELARSKNIPVIEDAAQAFFAQYKGRLVGTIGEIGCFSLQQGKHMTTGEGGFVMTSDERFARRMKLFIDKAWGYGDPNPDHYFLALNYRMTELQGAVALAQFEKVEGVVKARTQTAARMDGLLADLDGIETPQAARGATHVYWKYCLGVDKAVIEGGVDKFASELKDRGVFCAPRYIQKPAFMCEVIRERRTFGKSGFPFEGPHREGLPPIVYDEADYPGTKEALERVCVLPWNEFYSNEDVDFIAEAVAEVARKLRK